MLKHFIWTRVNVTTLTSRQMYHSGRPLLFVRRECLAPESVKLLPQVLVLLGNRCVYWADNFGVVLIRQVRHLVAHFSEVDIQPRPYVQTVLGRWLDQEPGTLDILRDSSLWENDIAELFLRSELIKCRLLQKLQGELKMTDYEMKLKR